MSKPLSIAIIGGGIAGLALAVGIIKQIQEGANIHLQIYEQAAKFAEIGAGVAIGPNALRALHLLGLEPQMQVLCNAPPETKDTWFEFRFAEVDHPDRGKLVHKITGKDAGNGNVHRANFLDALIEIIPLEYCKFDHRLVDYTNKPDGSVELVFGNGNKCPADLVLACDGIKSTCRKILYRHLGIEKEAPRERYAEWIAWRGLIPAEIYAKTMDRDGRVPIMWLGLDRHILTFPVKRGEQVNVVGFVRDPGHIKINGQTSPWAEERPKAEMLEDFKGYQEECLAMLGAIEKPSVWGIFDLPPLSVFHGQGVLLTGDAAHATTPHQGSGAGQAIEDALFLSNLLGHLSLSQGESISRDTIDGALRIYGEVRHERAARIQTTSAQAGLLYEGRGVGEEGQSLEKVAENLNERMRWIWEYDTEGELKRMMDRLTSFSAEKTR